MKLISISGKAGSGKDTAHRLLSRHLVGRGFTCEPLRFAATLKTSLALMYNWDLERLVYDGEYKEGDTLDDGSPDLACSLLGMNRRQAMQRYGTEAVRDNFHIDAWIISHKVAVANGAYDGIDYGIVVDARFLNELSYVYDTGGITLRVNRLGEESTLTQSTDHASENEWANWTNWGAVIDNTVDPSIPQEVSELRYQQSLIDALGDY